MTRIEIGLEQLFIDIAFAEEGDFEYTFYTGKHKNRR